MISCTEFIPLYSELFKFLEKEGGYDAVMDYWYFICENGIGNKQNKNSLISFLERDKDNPMEGAWKYWEMSLTEEACDLIRLYNPEKDCIYSHMRHCPSRGMLNELSHVEPYHDYCQHCNEIYRPVLEQYGLTSRRDNTWVENAECRSIIFKQGKDPGVDLATVKDEEMICQGARVMDLKRGENKYLHRDFHFHGDLALRYLGKHFGENGVRKFLTDYVNNFYAPLLKDAKKRGLVAIREWIERLYTVEEAEDLLETTLEGDTLSVKISESPAIRHLRATGTEPCAYYIEQTRTLYSAMADSLNLSFNLSYYDDTGKAEFTLTRRKYGGADHEK